MKTDPRLNPLRSCLVDTSGGGGGGGGGGVYYTVVHTEKPWSVCNNSTSFISSG